MFSSPCAPSLPRPRPSCRNTRAAQEQKLLPLPALSSEIMNKLPRCDMERYDIVRNQSFAGAWLFAASRMHMRRDKGNVWPPSLLNRDMSLKH